MATSPLGIALQNIRRDPRVWIYDFYGEKFPSMYIWDPRRNVFIVSSGRNHIHGDLMSDIDRAPFNGDEYFWMAEQEGLIMPRGLVVYWEDGDAEVLWYPYPNAMEASERKAYEFAAILEDNGLRAMTKKAKGVGAMAFIGVPAIEDIIGLQGPRSPFPKNKEMWDIDYEVDPKWEEKAYWREMRASAYNPAEEAYNDDAFEAMLPPRTIKEAIERAWETSGPDMRIKPLPSFHAFRANRHQYQGNNKMMKLTRQWSKTAYYIPEFVAILMYYPDKIVRHASLANWEGHYDVAKEMYAEFLDEWEAKGIFNWRDLYEECHRGVYHPRTGQLAMLSSPPGWGPATEEDIPEWEEGARASGIKIRQFGYYDGMRNSFIPIERADEEDPEAGLNRRLFDPELYPGASEWKLDPYFDPKGYERRKRMLTGF
jgi:hypothetical protein